MLVTLYGFNYKFYKEMSSFSVVENSFLPPPPCLHLILNVEKLSLKPSSSFTSRGVEIEFCFLELVIFLLWVECHYCSKRGMNERIWVRIQVWGSGRELPQAEKALTHSHLHAGDYWYKGQTPALWLLACIFTCGGSGYCLWTLGLCLYLGNILWV